MAAAIQLAISTYASYVGEQVHYGDWLKVSHCFVYIGKAYVTGVLLHQSSPLNSFARSLWYVIVLLCQPSYDTVG